MATKRWITLKEFKTLYPVAYEIMVENKKPKKKPVAHSGYDRFQQIGLSLKARQQGRLTGHK